MPAILCLLTLLQSDKKVGREADLRERYRVLADALRRKDWSGVSRLALPSYRTAGLGERPRPFAGDLERLTRAFAPYTRTSYAFKGLSVRLKGEEALCQSLETARQYVVVGGHRRYETLWAPRRDAWLLVNAKWRLAMTYYPQGFRTYPEGIRSRRPVEGNGGP